MKSIMLTPPRLSVFACLALNVTIATDFTLSHIVKQPVYAAVNDTVGASVSLFGSVWCWQWTATHNQSHTLTVRTVIEVTLYTLMD